MNDINNISPNYEEIGYRLKTIRGAKTLMAFAQSLGYSFSYVRGCENGKKQSLEYLFSVSNTYNISIGWILKGEEAPLGDKNINCEIYDKDLEYMVSVLKDLMDSNDTDMRSWAKVQFKKAFSDACTEFDRKKFIKQHVSIPSLVEDKHSKYGN